MPGDSGDLRFQFRHGTAGETPSVVYSAVAADIAWALDSAPHLRLTISNPEGRRANWFQAGDRWEVRVGKGGVPEDPLFIGRHPPSLDARYNSSTAVLDLLGYSSRMAEISSSIDKDEYAGWDVMMAVKDSFSYESALNTDGIYGSNPAVPVAKGLFATEARYRSSIIKTLMEQAVNLSDVEHPTMYHWREIPVGGNPAIQQITGIDRTDSSFKTADVLVSGTDFFEAPRDWKTRGFNAAWFKAADGTLQEFFFNRGSGGKVHTSKTYSGYEEARKAVAESINTPSFEIRLKSDFHHLRPGDVVEITGTKAVTDGNWQIAEMQYKYSRESAAIVAKLSESSAAI